MKEFEKINDKISILELQKLDSNSCDHLSTQNSSYQPNINDNFNIEDHKKY